MTDLVLFAVVPYLAVAVALVGLVARYAGAGGPVTARSSQVLESRLFHFGALPWHVAVLSILAAHVLAFLAPGLFGRILGSPARVHALEVVGLALGVWAVIAAAVLLVRRLAVPRVRAVTTVMDVVVIGLLLAQVALGVYVALSLRWGSVWYLHTAVPWLRSLVALSPEPGFAALLPTPVKLHAILAFAIVALLPFTRLVHVVAVPLRFLGGVRGRTIWSRASVGVTLPRPRATVLKERALEAQVLSEWSPEDRLFWDSRGRAVATRNLWISIPALFLSFAVWMVWSVVVVRLPAIGFPYTTDQLFWLAALPGLSGATLRIFYSFMVPILGGRLWTVLSTASLLLPAIGIGYAVQDPSTSYGTMLVLALLCGFGGGNFASSMANISFFFPKEKKGTALGLNAGLGNLGVSGMQFVIPLVITAGVFGGLGGAPQTIAKTGETLWLQNAAFVWVPFVLASTLAAWLGMDDIASAKASFREQAVVFRRKHNWIMCWLYLGTFGSFIGYSAGLPLLVKTQFAGIDPIKYAFLGPLVGALVRPVGGWLSDKIGGARVTFWNFVAMAAAAGGVLVFLPQGGQGGSFPGFLAMFLLLFATSGIGNGSTFRMIPVIFSTHHDRLAEGGGSAARAQAKKDAAKEAAAVLGFSSAVAAYGAFFIPRAFGISMKATGSPAGAILGFIAVYVSCLAVTWWFYSRKKAEMPC